MKPGETVKKLGFDRNQKSRGFAHLACWDLNPNKHDFKRNGPVRPPVKNAVKAGTVDLAGTVCICGCDLVIAADYWVVCHEFKGRYKGEFLFWKCSMREAEVWFRKAEKKMKKQKRRIKELEAQLDGLFQYTDDVDLVLRTTTDTLKHS
jgi:hypothetical protein